MITTPRRDSPGSALAHVRWDAASPEARAKVVRELNRARLAKMRARRLREKMRDRPGT